MKRLSYLLICAALLPAGVPQGTFAAASKKMPWAAEHDEAIATARAGNPAKALVTLNKLFGMHPQDTTLAQDYTVVANWAGQHSDAVQIYSMLPETNQPDYVLLAAGRSYRSLKQWNEALAVFQKGLRQHPSDMSFAEGNILCLADSGQPAAALEAARENLNAYGQRLDILLAAAYAARAANLPVEALRYSQTAMQLFPQSKPARRDLIESVNNAGAPDVALKLADATPDLLLPQETRRMNGDAAASIVRVETLDPFRESERYIHTDRAVARYDGHITDWHDKGKETQGDVLRMRFDRMVALRDRSRMQEVLAEYDALRKANITLPLYALNTAGDAYLYLRQPEKALEIYEQVQKANPKDFNIRMAIFYTYIEMDRYEQAYKLIDALVQEQPKWIRLKGLNEPQPNPQRAAAELAAAQARLYGNQHAQAENRLTPLAEAAPANSHYRAALGAVYENRGQPRRALEEYQIGKALARGQDATSEAGEARADLDLQDYRKSERETADLQRRFPENLEIRKLARDWDIHTMNEVNINVNRDLRSSGNATGGQGINLDTQYYSRPIDYNWRILAGEYYAHEHEPNNEGKMDYSRSSLGVEYRGHGITASATPTYNAYNSRQRAGVRVEGDYAANDHWNFGGSGEIFARDTPLRALNAGVTANAIDLNASYHKNESRELRISSGYTPFSDGNRRLNLGAMISERLYTTPTLKLDGVADTGFSSNSKDQNRLYYNPEQDVMNHLGVSITHTLYRRYDFLYQHTLKILPGYYWEKNYGSSPAFSAQYEQMLTLNDVMRMSLGVTYSRQDYDGETENNLSLIGNFNYRF